MRTHTHPHDGSRTAGSPWRPLLSRLRPAILVLLAAAPAPAAAAEARSGAALEILRKSSDTLRDTTSLSYRFDYIGGGLNLGRARGSATVLRDSTGKLVAFRGDVEVLEPVTGFGEHPRRYELAQGFGKAWRLDKQKRLLETGSISRGAAYLVTRGAGFFLFPQLTRPEPLSVEIEQPERIRLLGEAEVAGAPCHLISLTFPDDSGLGSQRFYIGRDDHLPRRIDFMAPAPAGPGLFIMTMILSDLRTGMELAPRDFEASPPARVRVVDRDQLTTSEGDPSPSWEIPLHGGGTVSAESLRGRYAVLEFWASWCPVCRVNLPYLDRMAREAGGKARILAVNIWEEDEDALAFFEEEGFQVDLALGGDALAEKFKVRGTPTAVVIDPDGKILLRSNKVGEARDEELRKILQDTLP